MFVHILKQKNFKTLTVLHRNNDDDDNNHLIPLNLTITTH